MKIYHVIYSTGFGWKTAFITATSKVKVIASVKKVYPNACRFKVVIAGDV